MTTAKDVMSSRSVSVHDSSSRNNNRQKPCFADRGLVKEERRLVLRTRPDFLGLNAGDTAGSAGVWLWDRPDGESLPLF